jgi:tRNA(Arg) A34 adenosine deaminase TadA
VIYNENAMTKSMLDLCIRHVLRKETRAQQWMHWAFVVQRNQIVEWATNRDGASWTARGYSSWQARHAETEAWRRAKGVLDRMTPWEVVSIRINKQRQLRQSQPCPVCARFLTSEGCKRVWFSNSHGEFHSHTYT